MSVTGLCQICESAQAQFACDRCGSVVCDVHYDSELGLCSECAQDVRSKRVEEESGPGEWGDAGPR